MPTKSLFAPQSTRQRGFKMRNCSKCNRALPAECFHSKSARCRDCKREIDKGRIRHGDPRDPRRNATPAARARKRRWALTHKDPIKNAARRAVRNAIQYGRLTMPNVCCKCGIVPKHRTDGARGLQAHHHNGYEAKLDIVWLCPPCHRIEHTTARAERKEKE